MAKIISVKVADSATRDKALQVIEKVFLEEKKWKDTAESQLPENMLQTERCSWFLVLADESPAGVIRLFYDPPLDLPPEFKATFREDIDLEGLKKAGRFVEVGRFMILPEYRRKIMVSMRLMRAALNEVVARDYTHFITDVYENELHSPYYFHTRILGFEVIGKHLFGELKCSCSRIILTLDILKAYKNTKKEAAACIGS